MRQRLPTLSGIHPLPLLVTYIAIALTPLALAYVRGLPPRGFRDGLSSAFDYLDFEGREHWLYVVCGPAAMIDTVENSLERLGVPLRQIISEGFSYD